MQKKIKKEKITEENEFSLAAISYEATCHRCWINAIGKILIKLDVKPKSAYYSCLHNNQINYVTAVLKRMAVIFKERSRGVYYDIALGISHINIYSRDELHLVGCCQTSTSTQ